MQTRSAIRSDYYNDMQSLSVLAKNMASIVREIGTDRVTAREQEGDGTTMIGAFSISREDYEAVLELSGQIRSLAMDLYKRL